MVSSARVWMSVVDCRWVMAFQSLKMLAFATGWA
jgi:hypothetical protein